MRIKLAFVGSSVSSFGFRVLGAMIEKAHPDTTLYFILAENFRKLLSILFSDASSRLSPAQIDEIGRSLADADVVGLSCFTEYAHLTKDIIAAIRRHRPDTYIVWGGVHSTADPDDCIAVADAVGIGEAEVSFPELLRRLALGQPADDIPGFWFRKGETVLKNTNAPLLSSSELEALPHPLYGHGEFIFTPDDTVFRPMVAEDYIDLDALSYNTVWSRGCPFKCSYCGNTRLLDLDRDYARVRNSSVEHIIDEVETVIRRFPHIAYVVFHDDCMISLPAEILEEFSRQWRARIALPFAVTGVTPAHLKEEKVKILLMGGLNRVRMGIQSGSDRILKFYRRPNRAGLITEATRILGRYSKDMMPPHYDMIFDNPIETKEDVEATLRLINDMPRPFMINVFSLRSIPNTVLGQQLAELGTAIESIERDYTSVMPTFANTLMYLCAIARIPAPLFDRLLGFAHPYTAGTHVLWQPMILLLRAIFMAKRAYFHIRWKDFSIVFGRLGLRLTKIGLLDKQTARPNLYHGLLKLAPPSETK